MNTTFSDIEKMMKDMNERISKEGKAMLQGAFVDFFRNNPEVKAVRWTQYTPYFNDGEACEFGVHAADFAVPRSSLAEDPSYADEYEDAEDHVWMETGSSHTTYGKFWAPFMKEAGERILEGVFGDHVRIIATPSGKSKVKFEVEDYSHD